MTTWVTEAELDLDGLLRETDDPSCGALAVFAGTVREQNEGRAVTGMTYEAHPVLAARTLAALEREALERFDIARCRIQHRIGALALGDVSVLVVVRSPHRGAAFEAAQWAIDTLKERAEVWKHEHYVEGDSAYLDGASIAAPESEGGGDA